VGCSANGLVPQTSNGFVGNFCGMYLSQALRTRCGSPKHLCREGMEEQVAAVARRVKELFEFYISPLPVTVS
jgi:hypothetical protein